MFCFVKCKSFPACIIRTTLKTRQILLSLSPVITACIIHVFIFVRSHLSNDFCQARVAHDQPAARSDAVGLVLKLLWVQFIKVFKSGDTITSSH